MDLQYGVSVLLAHGHGYSEILSWTWEQMGFAVLGILEYEADRLEETARYLAPMMGGKFKSETTGRERRVKAVVEAMRVKIQTASGDHEAAILDQIVAMVESGIEVEAPPEIMDKVAKRLSRKRRS